MWASRRSSTHPLHFAVPTQNPDQRFAAPCCILPGWSPELWSVVRFAEELNVLQWRT
jgi:hypothetical protein